MTDPEIRRFAIEELKQANAQSHSTRERRRPLQYRYAIQCKGVLLFFEKMRSSGDKPIATGSRMLVNGARRGSANLYRRQRQPNDEGDVTSVSHGSAAALSVKWTKMWF